ncbi:MAG: hypothetical protein ABJH52_07610 [Henriciella sp.]
MWYLWLQILFLLALAALCGAGLAYWWLKGRYEDVTETYSEMMINKGGSPDLITRPDLDARFADLSAKIDRIEATDLTPLHSQITSLADGLPSNEVELSPILSEIHAIGGDLRSSESSMQGLDERLAAIEASLHQANAGQDRLDELNNRMTHLETGLTSSIKTSFEDLQKNMNSAAPVDLGPMLSRVAELKQQIAPLSGLDSKIDSLTLKTNNMGDTYAAPIKSDIARLEQNFIALKESILHPLQQDLQMLNAKMPSPADITKLMDGRLTAIEEQVGRTQQYVRPMAEKVDEISLAATANSTNHRSLSAMDQKLSEFEHSVVGIKQRMDQVGALLAAMDKRQDSDALETKLDQSLAEMSSLRGLVSSKSTLEPLEQSIAHLQQMVFNLRERDLTSVNNAIRSIEGRVDFVGVENRLTSIEYGLAATHHMLRSKLEQGAEMPAPPQREPFREAPEEFSFTSQSSLKAPEAPLDPINMIRTSSEDGNLLQEPGFGQADNLEKIRGIGPMLRQLLNDTGVFYYWQIAEWSEADVASVDSLLPGYQGRIDRDRWVEQARELSELPGAAERPQPFGKDR